MSDYTLGILGGAALAAVAVGLSVTERAVQPSGVLRGIGVGSGIVEWLVGVGLYLAAGLCGGDWIAAACAGAAVIAGFNAARTDLSVGTVSDFASLVVLAAGAFYAYRVQSDISLLESAAGGILTGGILLFALVIVQMRRGVAGLGSGDILLGFAAGFWTGYDGVGPALLVAVAVTSLYAVMRKARHGTRLPFAPGLVIGFGLISLLQVAV